MKNIFKESEDGRLSDMERKIERLEKNSVKLIKVDSKLSKLSEIYAALEKNKTVDVLIKNQKAIKVLSNRLDVMLLKTDNVREFSYCYPHESHLIIACLDKPDEWWAERKDLKLCEFHDELTRKPRVVFAGA